MLCPMLLLFAPFLLEVSAKVIDIDVGKGGLTFNPDTVTAAVGDELHFHFYPQNHSVVQGDFTNACHPVATAGFFSGFMPVDSGEEGANMFVVTVSSTDPMFFYCSQVGHCKSGMVGVANPSSDQTLDSYRSAANGASSVSSPPSVMGGMIVPNVEESSTTSSTETESESETATTETSVTSNSGSTEATLTATTTEGSASASVSGTSKSTASTPTASTVPTSGDNKYVGDPNLRSWVSVGVIFFTLALVGLVA